MMDLQSSKNREGAFWKKRLPSFFLGVGVLFLLSSCKSLEKVRETDWGAKRSQQQIQRIQKERKIAFAVMQDAREEKALIALAGKAASLLGVKLDIYRTSGEMLPVLLRSQRVDFAAGSFSGREEVLSLYLQPLVIEGKEKRYIFALSPNGKVLAGMLKDALDAALVRGGIDE